MTALINPFWAGVAAPIDPYFGNVVLLCHFDGTNGATSFTDSSSKGHTVTASGGPTLTTAQQKFGTGSLQVSGAGQATSADSPDWDFGTGQFTVEAWVRSTHSIGGLETIVGRGNYGSTLMWVLLFQGAGNLGFYFAGSNGSFGAFATPTNTWLHVAADRDAAGTIRWYGNGAVVGTIPAQGGAVLDSSDPVLIGNDPGHGWVFTGQIDDLRITKGVARYAGVAFTPPTAPFPDA